MTPEEVASRHNQLPGYRLVSYHSVALPLWFITFDAIVIAEKKIPVVDEFILRSIERGIDTTADLSGFLGLSERLVVRRVGNLVATDLVRPAKGANDAAVHLVLTRRGTDANREALRTPPRRERLQLPYDAIARRALVGRVARDSLRTSQQVRQYGLFELPALPGRAPDEAELAKIDFNAAVPRDIRADMQIHQVLSARKVGATTRRFREAVMLVFTSIADPGQVAVRFYSLDARPLPDIDRGFVQNQGLQRLDVAGQLKRHKEAVERELSQDEDYNVVVQFARAHPAAPDISESIARTTKLSAAIEDREEALLEAPADQIARLKAELEALRLAKAEVEKRLSESQARYLEPQEHVPLFEKALVEARRRLMVISPWVNDSIMLPKLRQVEVLLARGVEVYVGYGITERAGDQRKKNKGEKTIAWFLDAAGRYDNLHVVKLGDTHAKVLLVDEQFVAVGSFNWMSFGGTDVAADGSVRIREELSAHLTAPELVEKMFQRYLRRFEVYHGGSGKKSPLDSSTGKGPLEELLGKAEKAPVKVEPKVKADQHAPVDPALLRLTARMISEHLEKKVFVILGAAVGMNYVTEPDKELPDPIARAIYKKFKATPPSLTEMKAMRSEK